MRTNEYGQPVGDDVPDWSPRPPVQPVTLVGRTVVLEPLTEAHAPGLYKALCADSPPTLWTYLPWGPYSDENGGRAFVATVLAWAGAVPHAVVVDDVPLGVASYLRNDPVNGSVEVGGIALGAALQRTTAATEVMALMARHVFDDLGYRRYEWKCDSLNEPSRQAAARLGFAYEGRFRQAVVVKGRNRDTDWFAMTDADWPRISAAYDAWLAPENFDVAGRQRRPLGAAVSP